MQFKKKKNTLRAGWKKNFNEKTLCESVYWGTNIRQRLSNSELGRRVCL